MSIYPTKQASVRDPAVWVGAGNLLFHYTEVPTTNALRTERRTMIALYGYRYSYNRTKLILAASLLVGKCGVDLLLNGAPYSVADLDVR